ncbi:MAG: DUF1254 domain-containing protein [Halobacteriota archaeon]|jgi:hypothetical protein
MKPFWKLSIVVIIVVILASVGYVASTTQGASTTQTIDGITIPTTTGPPTPAEARQIAAAAYVFGYPLVFNDVLKDHQTAVPAPNATLGVAPVNQLVRPYQVQQIEKLQASTYPITDASYVGAWLNLTKEPMVLSVPASNGRYYVMMLEDAWTNDLSSVGPRTTGNGSGNFAVVGPGWNGTLPSNVTRIQSSTNTVWLAGRTQENGPADLPATAAFLDNVTLTPLSEWGTNYTPPATVPVTSNVSADPRPSTSAAEIANMTPDVFYSRMATVMAGNPPYSVDKPVVDQIARIGIVPGTSFAWNSLNATMQNAITQGYQDGIAQVNAAAAHWPGVVVVNGWNVTYNMGAYGTNYTLRAGLAAGYPTGNLPQDALYWWSFTNSTGVPYSGANNYVLHFANNSIPPVYGFWSVTIYDSQGHFVPNPLNQYAITSHSGNVTYNPDGSLDIYIQNASPGAGKESNWLPAPSGGFALILRQYWPQESALNGSWVPRAVQTVGPATTTTNATTSAS